MHFGSINDNAGHSGVFPKVLLYVAVGMGREVKHLSGSLRWDSKVVVQVISL